MIRIRTEAWESDALIWIEFLIEFSYIPKIHIKCVNMKKQMIDVSIVGSFIVAQSDPLMNMVLIHSAQKYDEHIDVITPRADDRSVIRVTWHWTSSSWFK